MHFALVLLKEIFPNSKTATNVSCAIIKTEAIVNVLFIGSFNQISFRHSLQWCFNRCYNSHSIKRCFQF